MSVQILRGDCRQLLKTLPDQSVHCCVTSPPYWNLRAYLPPDHPEKHLEIGSEPTVHEWVQTMVEVFREVRRVLRDDGTLWLNLGDSYAGSRCGGGGWPGSTLNGKQTDHSRKARVTHQGFTPGHKNASSVAKLIQRASRNIGGGPQAQSLMVPRSDVAVPGLKPKDLIGQPWRVAFALQADGWWLRQEIIWGKLNPMPESCRDRFTKAHEQVFLLTKRETYYFDFDAIQEPASQTTHERRAGTGVGFGHGYDAKTKPRVKYGDLTGQNTDGHHRTKANLNRRASPKAAQATADDASAWAEGQAGAYVDGKSERMGRGPSWRNKQNASFDEAMAVMPATRNPRSVRMLASEPFKGAHYATYPPALIEPFILAGCPEGGTVLDPFGGSGTTAVVCDRLGRNAILMDLDERNVPMSQKRLAADRGSVHRQLPIPLEAA